jgi:hypothetical protein
MYVYPADLHRSVQKTLNPATPYSGYKQAITLLQAFPSCARSGATSEPLRISLMMGSLVLDFVQPERFQCADSRLDTKCYLRGGGGGKKRRGRVLRSGGWKLTVMRQASNNYLSFYLTAEIHGSSSHLRALGWWVFFLSSPPPKCLYSSFFWVFIVQCSNRVIVEGAHQALPTHLKCMAALERQTLHPEFQTARF